MKEIVLVGPTLPAPSLARTANVCGPAGSEGVVKGDAQGVNGPPSMLHSKLEPGSLALNSKVGESSSVGPEGPAVIAVSGGVVSAGGPAVTTSVVAEADCEAV